MIVVDKPTGWTSHDVVAEARRLWATIDWSLGTLDPIATASCLGHRQNDTVMPILWRVGEAFGGAIRLGFATDTYDADETPQGRLEVEVTLEQLWAHGGSSAHRADTATVSPEDQGVAASKLARRSMRLSSAVRVEVKEYTILVWMANGIVSGPCFVGDLCRSIAHGGQKLGCGAHLASLAHHGR